MQRQQHNHCLFQNFLYSEEKIEGRTLYAVESCSTLCIFVNHFKYLNKFYFTNIDSIENVAPDIICTCKITQCNHFRWICYSINIWYFFIEYLCRAILYTNPCNIIRLSIVHSKQKKNCLSDLDGWLQFALAELISPRWYLRSQK